MLEELEKLVIEPFSEFGWKSWKTIGFSPALVGTAGIVLGLIIINSITRRKAILSRNMSKVETIVQYLVGQAFFYRGVPGLEFFPVFCQGGW